MNKYKLYIHVDDGGGDIFIGNGTTGRIKFVTTEREKIIFNAVYDIESNYYDSEITEQQALLFTTQDKLDEIYKFADEYYARYKKE